MKIFISWSGPYSHGVALALKRWLRYIFTDAQAFVSSEDVRKGKRWLIEISKELSSTSFGIVCLTPDNLDSPWLLFEAGALSKLQTGQVCTLLLGNLRPGDIEGPLADFQSTQFNKADFLKLLQSINDNSGRGRLEDTQLETMFEKWWPDLDKEIATLSKISETGAKDRRSERDLLYELIEITRYIARNSPANRDEELRKLKKLVRTSVEDLQLSKEALRALKVGSVQTLGKLSTYSGIELIKLCGSKQVHKELNEKLKSIGLSFGMTYAPGVFEDLQ